MATWLSSLHGTNGAQGEKGEQGAAGKSAYELAKEQGFDGTIDEWLASLVGNPGPQGMKGDTGAAGKSAYELAVAGGYEGSQQEWLLSLRGTDGKSAYELAVDAGFEGGLTAWLASLKGEQGEKGDAGAAGPQGLQGLQGDPGRGIASMEIIDGELWVTYTDGETVNVGQVNEQEVGTDGLDYYLLPDGTYAVTAGTACYASEIVIPAYRNGKPVTTILESGFKDSVNMISLTIPETITSVGADAWPSPHTNNTTDFILYYEGTIEQWCWIEFAERLSNPLSMSYGKNAKFYFDGELITGAVDVIIPDGITAIAYSFIYLPLNSVTIPASVTKIVPGFGGTNLNYAYFEVTTGWKADPFEAWEREKSLSSSELADPQTAADMLLNDYASFTWTRS